jgi:mono/diheme cytochrome c family protein
MSEGTEKSNRLAAEIRDEALRRDRRVKIGLLAASLLTIALLAAAALRENVLAPWRLYQKQYARILATKAVDDRGRSLLRNFHVEMKQAVLPELGTIDRCVSCHNGIDDPRMAGLENPHAVHPGQYLEWHEVGRFGCTVCHRGQGRAMDFKDAKAEGRHWDYPLLPTELSQSSCGLCHSAREVAERGGEVYAAGAALFEVKGCRSCHKLGGRGGNLGPALDNEGLKVTGSLPMANVNGPHTLPQWLVEHFADPQRIVAGSRMPTPGLSRAETTALTTYLLSLQQRDLPGSYLTPERHLVLYAQATPDPMTGEQLFSRFCSTCHDTGLMGRYDKFFQSFIPAVRGESFRASADPSYVSANIRYGRAGTIMPAWGSAAGGMSDEDIRRLTSYILGREAALAEIAPVTLAATDVGTSDTGRGAALFLKNCSGCHGTGGEGKIAPSLNSHVLRTLASDAFLARTIASGRRNTAMPAWRVTGGLTDRDIGDLIAHIRSLR